MLCTERNVEPCDQYIFILSLAMVCGPFGVCLCYVIPVGHRTLVQTLQLSCTAAVYCARVLPKLSSNGIQKHIQLS